ncbi:DUF1942 domain-containing protein [Mycolicibacterium sp. S3B2]|uniref:DUF1942 domain-containing protein n=1 Tax=Mycolicibacterium sp. S3B2 TaxID=3415120 RepID=UPI003C7C947D
MKITTAFAASVVAVGAVVSAPLAHADDATTTETTLGQPAELVNGAVVQSWTVSALKPSSDHIPWQVHGTLWEATATNEALQGSVQPVVSDLRSLGDLRS